jgi:hypothetical protein
MNKLNGKWKKVAIQREYKASTEKWKDINDTRMQVATQKTSGSEKYGAHASANIGLHWNEQIHCSFMKQ